MNPIYKFDLTVNGTTQRAYPIYNNELSLSFEKETGQEFFRRKLSGELEFQSVDYRRIVAAPFDTRFGIVISISYNAGATWSVYWSGEFWKTDCKFDADSETVTVTPSVKDQYTDVLAGIEKEYNLIDLKPEITPVTADKRPMIQVYVPGQTVISCFLSGMWWEQECEAVTDVSKLTEVGDGKLNFALNRSAKIVEITGGAGLPDVMVGNTFSEAEPGTYTITSGGYRFTYFHSRQAPEGYTSRWQIERVADNVVLWQYENHTAPLTTPYTVTLAPVSGTGASGNVSLYITDIPVYSRYLLDVSNIAGVNTYAISTTDDIVPNNRNYSRVVGYGVSDIIYFSVRLASTTTEWGLYKDGKYYLPPYTLTGDVFFPIARRTWGRVSIWFSFSTLDKIFESAGRASFVIKDAYPLANIIQVLLWQISPNIKHLATVDYSRFLYGTNPVTGIDQTLLITPKSNVISAGYDQPAQKAPITLKNITDMLRDCFRCYWFVDEQNRFRIEHISYFMNGGSYSGSPSVGMDLTTKVVARTGKKWAFAKDQYEFEKPEMAGRYQFGWMDDVTQPFEGYPIDIVSGYVDLSKIEDVNITRFTSDIDYILLNPGAVSKDGFVLLAGVDMTTKMAGLTASTTAGGDRFLSPNMVVPVGEYGKKITITVRGRGKAGTTINAVFSGTGVWQYPGLSLRFTQTDVWVTKTQTFVIPTNTQNDIVLRWYFNSGVDFGDTTVEIVSGVFDDSYMLPYQNIVIDGDDHYLQNGYLAFDFLQRYYDYDMPARNYEINGVAKVALGVKKLKTQTIRFPVAQDPDLVKLIKTNLGNGVIDKISVNLSSREANATLRYDTE